MPPDDKDIIIVTIRGTEEERAYLQRRADKLNVSLNQYVRSKLDLCIRDRRRKDYKSHADR